MDYIFWLIIGLVLMAIELVIPGGIAGLIGYCLFMWGVFIGLGGTDIAGYVSNDVLKDLAGKEGIAHTTLRPAGIAKIDGNLVDVVTEGDFIDAGSPIVVLRVVGGRNIVRKRD